MLSKKWYKNYEQNFFYNENKKLIRQQAFFNDGSGVQFTYKFDKNGNNIEILTENLNTKTKLWKNYEKTEYLYDLSIEKDEVIDRGHIIDEKEDSVNLILEKKDRNLAGPTAAPNGLYLKEIRYE